MILPMIVTDRDQIAAACLLKLLDRHMAADNRRLVPILKLDEDDGTVHWNVEQYPDQIAELAYELADAMAAARVQ